MKEVTVHVRDSFGEGVWTSVRRNVKVVSAWPEWKKIGSGPLDATGNAAPRDPEAASENPASTEQKR